MKKIMLSLFCKWCSQKAMSKLSEKDFVNLEKNTKKFKVPKTPSKETREVACNNDSYDFWTWLTPFVITRKTKTDLGVEYPANISTSDQCYFNIVDERLNNVDPTLKMKQNPSLKRNLTLTQRQKSILKHCYNVVSTLLQRSLNPV